MKKKQQALVAGLALAAAVASLIMLLPSHDKPMPTVIKPSSISEPNPSTRVETTSKVKKSTVRHRKAVNPEHEVKVTTPQTTPTVGSEPWIL